jgi:Fe-S-cluster containining protein
LIIPTELIGDPVSGRDDMPDNHDAILKDWRKNAAREEEANFRFLRSLKLVSDPDRIDALAHELHKDAFARIDCTRCANCCKTMQAAVTEEDSRPIAAHLGMAEDEFVAAYLVEDEEEGGHCMKAVPCPFLGEDDRCTIYAVRPEACREFPHTDKEGFARRTGLHTANTLRCPAVYDIVTQMRRRLRRR